MSRVAVVGAGTMGNGIAHVFAQHGWETTLIDMAPGLLERVLALIRGNFERQVKKGTVTAEQRDAALARIRTSPSLDAVADAELVVEAATERPDVKFKIFSDLDRLAPPAAILASNSSSIPRTATGARRPDRARRVPRDPRGTATRPGGRQVSGGAAAADHGGGRTPGSEERARLLCLPRLSPRVSPRRSVRSSSWRANSRAPRSSRS